MYLLKSCHFESAICQNCTNNFKQIKQLYKNKSEYAFVNALAKALVKHALQDIFQSLVGKSHYVKNAQHAQDV